MKIEQIPVAIVIHDDPKLKQRVYEFSMKVNGVNYELTVADSLVAERGLEPFVQNLRQTAKEGVAIREGKYELKRN